MNYSITADGRVDRSNQRSEISESISCEICDKLLTVPFKTVKAHYSDDWFSVSKCRGCGLILVNPRLSEQYRTLIYRQEKHLLQWFLNQQDYSRALADFILNDLRLFVKGGTLLKAGCGIGTFLEAAAKAGFETSGIELNEVVAEYAARKHTVFCGDFYHTEFSFESFDVIAMEQVMEHLKSPFAAMKKAHALLKPGGVLYVGVPRVDWLCLTLDSIAGEKSPFGKLWSPEDHIYYFTPQTMRHYLRHAGFEVLDSPARTLKRRIANMLGLSPGHFYARKIETR